MNVAPRLRAAGLVIAMLVVGLSFVIAITEHQAGANAAHSLLTTSDVIEALENEGLVVALDSEAAFHPLISVSGASLAIGTSRVEVYVFQQVRDRVADEQILQRYVMQLQTLIESSDASFRITSARNVLFLYRTDADGVAMSIQEAARTLSNIAGT